jgi:hypothetical protein
VCFSKAAQLNIMVRMAGTVASKRAKISKIRRRRRRPERWLLQGRKGQFVTGAALVATMQVSPHRRIELEPTRSRLPVRTANLFKGKEP